MNTLSDLAIDILARRLGQHDAAWLPIREAEWSNPGAIWLARNSAAAPAPLYQATASSAERQRFSRAGAELADAGLLHIAKPGHARLTPLGFKVARGLAWASTYCELREALNRLADRTDAGDCLREPSPGYDDGDGFVPEPFITGAAWDGTRDGYVVSLMLANTLLPAVAAGLVESASARRGQIFYRLKSGPVTDEQLSQLVDPALTESFDESTYRAYWAQRQRSRQQILTVDAAGELGFIALHAGILKGRRGYSDVADIAPLYQFEGSEVAA